MFRLLRLGSFFYISTWLVFNLAAGLSIRIELWSFVAGVCAAMFTGFAEFQINEWWSTIVKPYKPQSVKLETKETPSSITSAATKARFFGGLFVGVATFYLLILTDPSGSPLIRLVLSIVAGIATFLFLHILAALTNRPVAQGGIQRQSMTARSLSVRAVLASNLARQNRDFSLCCSETCERAFVVRHVTKWSAVASGAERHSANTAAWLTTNSRVSAEGTDLSK